ncbi:MAG TPA: hypothetical protein VFG76_05445, partial [Candidatus Polarisedimenticolia bacterium]|nr:hypothetical protein [Candidatus Polarisedimenticolia bacterium]
MSDPSSESPGIVLVAEPHATRRDLIESCFQRSGLGMRLVHCPSLEEAQSNLVASSPDLVICGDGLSREEARDLISSMALRSDGIPVFVLEDPAIGTAAVDLVSAGADDCLRVCDET